mmetsp:Transcript_6281/g.14193  ORF Transcript_6281/g.14193 Transcript_6281/m.14193 type:complete len:85 (+) Transcript_6281:176-430(+)
MSSSGCAGDEKSSFSADIAILGLGMIDRQSTLPLGAVAAGKKPSANSDVDGQSWNNKWIASKRVVHILSLLNIPIHPTAHTMED